MKAARNPREVIGKKRFKCDTKEGKKCVPASNGGGWFVVYTGCMHCGRKLKSKRSE